MEKEEVREKSYLSHCKFWESERGEDKKQKLSEKRSGKNNWFYGKTHDEKTRKRMSEAKKDIFNGEGNPAFRRDVDTNDLLFDFIILGLSPVAMKRKYNFPSVSKRLLTVLPAEEYKMLLKRNAQEPSTKIDEKERLIRDNES